MMIVDGMAPKHLVYLDCIRGYAIFMVIVCHLTSVYPELPYPVLRQATNGWYGVQLFFLAFASTSSQRDLLRSIRSVAGSWTPSTLAALAILPAFTRDFVCGQRSILFQYILRVLLFLETANVYAVKDVGIPP